MDQGNIWTKARQGAITGAWILSGAVSLYVFQNANRVEVKVDRVEADYKSFVESVRRENETRIAYEAATQNKVSNLSGRYTAGGCTQNAVLLVNFVEEVRKTAQAEIEKKRKSEL